MTTLCLALAATWPTATAEGCVVVEADPAGGDVAARFALPATPGLASLAAAARRATEADLVWRHAQTLPGGLSVVTAPPGADQARAALAALENADLLRRAGDVGTVVVDCGRLDPGSPAVPIVRAADHVLLVTRAHAADLAHVAIRDALTRSISGQVHMLLAGLGHSTGEVEQEIGVPVLARVPEDRRGAATMAGEVAPRGFWPARRRLARYAASIAADLAALTPPVPATTTDDEGVPAVGDDMHTDPRARVNGQAAGRRA
ncbi:chromosome partitioning protein [Phytoactinopolyspora endophytica]|uniref:chromosome partitioning protein n=1 Tax=Phytoactinopolyspora endophytica TaxID=1642495 RepID=UPI00101BBCBA|nr:chromosome partitioning protein [Phytoactinopolyspora endophytica]